MEERYAVKKNVQLLSKHPNPYIRLLAAKIQHEELRTQILMLEVIDALASANPPPSAQ
jgi:hypothetical protein